MFLIHLAILICITVISCTSPNTNDNEKEVHKVVYEELYDYYDNPHPNDIINDDNVEYDDTFEGGLESISKDTYLYKDRTSVYCLGFRILDADWEDTGKMSYLRIKDKDLYRIEEFLDSCIYGSKLSDDEEWRVKINDDTYFSYYSGQKTVNVFFVSETVQIDLLITPEKLKEVIEKAKKE